MKKKNTSKKRIIIINHYGTTPDLPGATKYYEMAQYFSKKSKKQVEFWMCGVNHHTGKNHKDLKGFKLQNQVMNGKVKIIRIKSLTYRNNLILRQLNISIFDFLTAMKILFSKNIQVVILSLPPISIFNVCAIKLRRIKLVTDVEDLWPLFLINMGMKNKVASMYMNKCADFTYKVSDSIAAVSTGMVKYLEKKTSKKVWLAPLGVNMSEYTNRKNPQRVTINREWKNDFKIMYIGAHGKANDLGSVLKTINEFKQYMREENTDKISFIFVGDGDQKERLIDLTKQLNLSNVYFEDPIPSEDVADYLAVADVCLTNLKKIDSFKLVRPNKLFQYMVMNKPIISGIWGESREIIERENVGIYIDFTQHSKAAQKLHIFLKNKEELIKMGQNGRIYIEKYGDRKKILEVFYTNVLSVLEEK